MTTTAPSPAAIVAALAARVAAAIVDDKAAAGTYRIIDEVDGTVMTDAPMSAEEAIAYLAEQYPTDRIVRNDFNDEYYSSAIRAGEPNYVAVRYSKAHLYTKEIKARFATRG